jgi:hypothetical protein
MPWRDRWRIAPVPMNPASQSALLKPMVATLSVAAASRISVNWSNTRTAMRSSLKVGLAPQRSAKRTASGKSIMWQCTCETVMDFFLRRLNAPHPWTWSHGQSGLLPLVIPLRQQASKDHHVNHADDRHVVVDDVPVTTHRVRDQFV